MGSLHCRKAGIPEAIGRLCPERGWFNKACGPRGRIFHYYLEYWSAPARPRHFPGREFKATTDHVVIYPYPVPYRCLYSRNIDNLFMAGRNISVTHVALGTVRVMRTTGMMGQVVGMAASLCKKYQATPRDIYRYHLEELKSLMQKGVNKKGLPNNQRYNEGGRLNQIPKVK